MRPVGLLKFMVQHLQSTQGPPVLFLDGAWPAEELTKQYSLGTVSSGGAHIPNHTISKIVKKVRQNKNINIRLI